ncbi:MAG: hypothetical protein JNM57_10815 [Cyclobacteriaceae bacterium]|nr:hypothetical protein [Cyclobacteriaceae bacterium]
MKTIKSIFSVFAFALAAFAAFAFNPKPVMSSAYFRVDAVSGNITAPYTQVSPTHWCEESSQKCSRLYETDGSGNPVIPLNPLAAATPGTYHN